MYSTPVYVMFCVVMSCTIEHKCWPLCRRPKEPEPYTLPFCAAGRCQPHTADRLCCRAAAAGSVIPSHPCVCAVCQPSHHGMQLAAQHPSVHVCIYCVSSQGNRSRLGLNDDARLQVCQSGLLAQRDSITPLFAIMVSASINLVVDILLIVVSNGRCVFFLTQQASQCASQLRLFERSLHTTQRFGFGIRGAAWATVGSQVIGASVLLCALQRSKVLPLGTPAACGTHASGVVRVKRDAVDWEKCAPCS